LRGDHDSYFTYLMEHLTQLLTDYGKVDFLFYDSFGAHDLKAYRPPLLNAYPRQLQPGIIINDRGYWNHGYWAGPEGVGHPDWWHGVPVTLLGDYSTPEQRVGEFDVTRAWESCITLTPGHWSWQSGASVNSFATVIGQLIGTSTGDGNLLLNVGPMPTGYVEPEQDARVREVGAWMQRYGEAIYGTRGGPFPGNEMGGSTFSGRTLTLFFTAELPQRVRLPGLNNPVLAARAFDSGLELGVENLPNGDTLIDLTGLPRIEPATLVQLTVTDTLSTEYTTTPMVVEPN
jgi:alpha-L-fucosidase